VKLSITLLLLLLAPISQAHYLWLEKSHDQARIYFGEWHKDLYEGKAKLQYFSAAKIFTSQPSEAAALSVEEGFLAVGSTGEGDIYMLLDSLPVKESRRGGIHKSYYYAKSGRVETQAKLGLELVPTQARGNIFTLLFENKALVGAEVIVYGPPKWEKHLRTDEEGRVSLDTPWAGQYLVKVSHKIPPVAGEATLQDPVVRHVYTGSFVVDDGVAWEENSFSLVP